MSYTYYKKLDDKIKIPDDAIKFDCWSYNLRELPELPIGLIELKCYGNKLTELPELPKNLKELHCNHNKLVELPKLPDKLEVLDSTWNNIKYLSLNNCQIVKNVDLTIMNNPISSGFASDREFQDSL